MKAWVLYAVNDIRYEDRRLPVLNADWVLLKVKACGICGSDIPRVYGTGAHKMPLVIGHEFSGVVEDIGKNVNPSWMGKRVGVYPLIPCRRCGPCQQGQFEMCRHYDYLGSRMDGAFAEYVVVPADNLIEVPETVSFEEAAMLEPMAVAVHAMRFGIGGTPGRLDKDAAIAVCGLGTIGLLLTEFLSEMGYQNLYVIGNKDFQKKQAASLGIADARYCDVRLQDAACWLGEQAGGVDVYFECVGKNACVVNGIHSAIPGGRIVLVGNPYSDMQLSKETYWKILRNQLTISGTWNSAFDGTLEDDWHYVMRKLEAKSIAPAKRITHRFSLEQAKTGLELMRDKSEDYGKVMIVQ